MNLTPEQIAADEELLAHSNDSMTTALAASDRARTAIPEYIARLAEFLLTQKGKQP